MAFFEKMNSIYFEKSFRIVSNTKTGPVLPKIVSGCPANKLYIIPHTAPDNRLSIADFNKKNSLEFVKLDIVLIYRIF